VISEATQHELAPHVPGRTGLELLQHLTARGFQIPAIIMRASPDPTLRERCEAASSVKRKKFVEPDWQSIE
jgi:CheY-like chemotaxis protein